MMMDALISKIGDRLRLRKEPTRLCIGIAGGSGSGKSTVSELLRNGLSSCNVTVIALDQFFKPVDQLPTYYSQHHEAPQPDFNRPDSLDAEAMLAYCQNLTATGVIILEGHLGLYYPALRELMDIKCFVECELTEMLARRTARNLAAGYGGDRENILAYNRECVVPRYEQFIQPTSHLADIVIPNSESDVANRDELIALLCMQISQQDFSTEHVC